MHLTPFTSLAQIAEMTGWGKKTPSLIRIDSEVKYCILQGISLRVKKVRCPKKGFPLKC